MKSLFSLTTLTLLLGTASASILGGSGAPVVKATQAKAIQPLQIKMPDGYVLHGELTLPKNAKAGQRCPTIILIHGSGPNDMNETFPAQIAGVPEGSAVFKQIKDKLNDAGFAVVRYNKRGVLGLGSATAMPKTLPPEQMVGPAYTISGFTNDAQNVLKFTRTLPAVDTKKVFLVGHSEGTVVSSLIARASPELLSGIVLMGTMGDTIRDTLHFQLVDRSLAQTHLLMDGNKDGLLSIQEIEDSGKKYGFTVESQAPFLGLVKEGDSWAFGPDMPQETGQVSIDGAINAKLEEYFSTFPELPGFPPSMVEWIKDAMKLGSVTEILPSYRGPVLMLQGAADPQTTLSAATKTYNAAKAAGKTNITFKVYPGLGHSLSPLKAGAVNLGPMEAQPLNDLAEWLRQQTR